MKVFKKGQDSNTARRQVMFIILWQKHGLAGKGLDLSRVTGFGS